MIFYFSATGNCRHVAQSIASETGDKSVSIQQITDSSLNLTDEKYLGFVTPTYAWGLPSMMRDFLSKTSFRISSDCYVYFISTFGTSSGVSSELGAHLLKKQGITVTSFFGVKMPDTWTPLFNLSDKTKIQKINDKADLQIHSVAALILNSKKHKPFRFIPKLTVVLISKIWYNSMRQTKSFYVEDTCIGCGLCAQNCPVQAIQLVNKKPVWTSPKCVMCLGCLHRCPEFAIQYGKHTKHHGQYNHPLNPC